MDTRPQKWIWSAPPPRATFAGFAVLGELCAKESLFSVQIPLTQSSQRTAKIANQTHGNRADKANRLSAKSSQQPRDFDSSISSKEDRACVKPFLRVAEAAGGVSISLCATATSKCLRCSQAAWLSLRARSLQRRAGQKQCGSREEAARSRSQVRSDQRLACSLD